MIAGTGAEHHRFAPVLALFGLVKTAAKRRRGLGTMSPSRFGRQPNVTPKNKREAVSEQNAKHSAIETGSKRKTRISQPINIEPTLKTAAKRRRESEREAPSVGVGVKPQAGFGRQPNVFPRFANLPYIKKSAPTRCRG